MVESREISRESRNRWRELLVAQPFGRSSRIAIVVVVGLSVAADLLIWLAGESLLTGQQRVFNLWAALVVAAFAWRPALATLALTLLVPMSWLSADHFMAMVVASAAFGLVLISAGRTLTWIYVATFAISVAVTLVLDPELRRFAEVLVLFVLGGASAVFGWLTRRTRVRESDLRESVARHELMLVTVRAQERERIADELHDGIARQLTVIAMQVRVLGRTDDAEVREASRRAIEDSAGKALADVRRALSLAQGPDRGAVAERTPEHFSAVLEQARTELAAEKVAVSAEVPGTAAPELPAVVDATLARILRESVHNVRKHAPESSRVHLSLSLSEQQADLQIVNAASGALAQPTTPGFSGGYGLVSLTERVVALGGTFDAGPTHDGGWRVAATLPVG